MNLLFDDSFWILYVASSLLLPLPCRPFAYHFTSQSATHILLIIHSPAIFPFAIQYCVLSVLFVIIAHSNMEPISLKTPKDNSYYLNSALRDIWQKQQGSREWKGKRVRERERVTMRKVFHSIRRGYTSCAPLSSCTYLQNELSKNSPTPLLWLCTQVQTV